jgi:hypothetical protein
MFGACPQMTSSRKLLVKTCLQQSWQLKTKQTDTAAQDHPVLTSWLTSRARATISVTIVSQAGSDASTVLRTSCMGSVELQNTMLQPPHVNAQWCISRALPDVLQIVKTSGVAALLGQTLLHNQTGFMRSRIFPALSTLTTFCSLCGSSIRFVPWWCFEHACAHLHLELLVLQLPLL